MPERYRLIEHILFPPTRLNHNRLTDRVMGKTILITGASYGIGESLAYMLAGTGAQLLLVARTEEKLKDVKNEVEKRGGNAMIYPTDLSNTEQVQQLAATLLQLPNGIDIIISNAGKSIRRPLHESLDRHHDFTRTMAINYLGPVQLLLSLIPMVAKNKGHIINVSSVSVLVAPAPYWAAYQASKSAFDQWFRCAGPELNAAGVNTTTVYLPLVRTRMMAPTVQYAKMPAMSPDHAARWICRSLYTKKSKVSPWWIVFGQYASILFRAPWEYFITRHLAKKQPYAP